MPIKINERIMWFDFGFGYGAAIIVSAAVGYSLLFHLLASIEIFRPEISKSLHNLHDIEPEELKSSYDFIIIGGGSAGTVLANRLSELLSCDILLLEAGDKETTQSAIPILWPSFQNTDVDWQFKTQPSTTYCLGSPNASCLWPRGKMLGGCSSMNAMFYTRGNRRDFDRWAAEGNSGWGFEDVLPYFKKSEDMRLPQFQNNRYHSTGGYYTVEYAKYTTPLKPYFFNAFDEIGLSNPGDYNGASQLGFVLPQTTVRDGLRCSNYKAFIEPAQDRPNLHIMLKAYVTKIIIDKTTKEASGVRFIRNGKEHVVRARKEVLLSAGAVQSPQLLMLSGIGPADELKRHGIEPCVNLQGVGRNLQDHVTMGGITVVLKSTNPAGPRLSYNGPELLNMENTEEFIKNKRGQYYGTWFDCFGWMNSPYRPFKDDWPDLKLYLVSLTNLDFSHAITKTGSQADGFMMFPSLMRPNSSGTIRLRSAKPFDYPIIEPNYFSDPEDLKIMVSSRITLEKILNTKAMRSIGATLVPAPGCDMYNTTSDEYYTCLLRIYTQSIWHPVGTCKMAPKSDPMAVVNSKLQVYGVKRLRVVDASVMPHITSGNTNAPTTMIAEKAADMIKEVCSSCAKPEPSTGHHPKSKESIEKKPIEKKKPRWKKKLFKG